MVMKMEKTDSFHRPVLFVNFGNAPPELKAKLAKRSKNAQL